VGDHRGRGPVPVSADVREALATLAATWCVTGDPKAEDDAKVLFGYLGHLDTESSEVALRRQAWQAARALEPPNDDVLDEIAQEIVDTLRDVLRAQRAEPDGTGLPEVAW
jgi:hypothetical protein